MGVSGMSGEAGKAPEDRVSLKELLEQARAAEAVVLPQDVRGRFCPYDIVRLRLLTFRHMVALGDFAAANATRWKAVKLAYLNDNWTQAAIARFLGVNRSTVTSWLNDSEIEPDVWQDVPLEAR